MCEETGGHAGARDRAGKVGADAGGEMVVAKVPQGFETRINIRLVPGRDVRFPPEIFGCRPRQGAPRRETEPLPLPGGLADRFKDVNKKVIEWLAREPANARLFLERPVEALLKAGVELTRAEQKALARSRSAASDSMVVPPGVNVVGLTVSAYPKGRVGGLKRGPRPKKEHDAAECEPTGKE
ncbi:MAG TPA: hypothetical protein VFF17_11110 [Thermoanaerobaculia bacterium]|nr:hypothetical protein [Thermoanaerobaculia bacterium]